MNQAHRQDPEDKVFMERDDFQSIGSDPSVGAVLCGFDINISELPDDLRWPQLMSDYKKLAKAFTYLRENEGCQFLLTNQDPTYPTSFATGDPDHPVKHALFPGPSHPVSPFES